MSEAEPTGVPTGQPDGPGRLSRVEIADLDDKYDRMMRAADLFDSAGEEMRARARLGSEVLRDPAVAESAPLAPATFARAEEDILAATTGRHGLLTRSIELDADALVVRATVLTYRWIDDLQTAAYETLGTIAGRALGYLAPEVALGGAIVSAGLIETDALDRDGIASYLSELAASNPELMDHVASGGGGMLDGLQMRAVLTAGYPAGPHGRLAVAGARRAMGAHLFAEDAGAALRDVAAGLLEPPAPTADDAERAEPADGGLDLDPAPHSIADLMTALAGSTRTVSVRRVGVGRYIAYLTGPDGGGGRRLRLVGADHTAYAGQVVRAISRAVAGDPDPHVMLVGSAAGGVTAAELAAGPPPDDFVIDQVVTAGSPSAHVPRIPESIRVLSLEDRSDPVALLGSLVNAGSPNRTTVVFAAAGRGEEPIYLIGARAADDAEHPGLRAEIGRIQALGYLGGESA